MTVKNIKSLKYNLAIKTMEVIYNIYIDGTKIGKSVSYTEAIEYIKEDYSHILPYLTWEPVGAGGVDCWSNGVNEIMIEKHYTEGINENTIRRLMSEHLKLVVKDEEEDEEEKKRMPFTPQRTTLKMKKQKRVSVAIEGEIIEAEDGKKYISKKMPNGKMHWTKYTEKKYKGAPKKGIRKSPLEPAKKYDEGTVKKGLDGNMWVVKQIANGNMKWIRKQ